MPIEIRPASAADEPAVTQIRQETWLTAYAQSIDPVIVERVTAPRGRGGAAIADPRVIVGYASYGPERSVASVASVGSGGSVGSGAKPGALTAAGLAGETGELYTLYVAQAHWSTGVGRGLTDAALDGLRAAGYRRVVLWTLTENARARRFYDKAGFAPDGATNLLAGLGQVEELRYARDL